MDLYEELRQRVWNVYHKHKKYDEELARAFRDEYLQGIDKLEKEKMDEEKM